MKALKSIGSKYRIVAAIAEALHGTGADLLVDVFGGSGAVTMNAGFDKRVYNDFNEDLVNFYRVLRDPQSNLELMRRLRRMPMSRREFEELDREYKSRGNSFRGLEKVARAEATFYRSIYCYGGKFKNGGFSVSASDRAFIKEMKTYRSRLRCLAEVAEFWMDTCLECLDFQDIISTYGRRENAVLYCDPPYFGTEGYYATTINAADHVFLAEQLNSCQAKAVVSYYRFPLMEDLYPRSAWDYRSVTATKNSMGRGVVKRKVEELILVKR